MRSTPIADLGPWFTAAGLPWVAVASGLHPRWRADWEERWGLRVAPVSPGATWIAASSVGEVRAAAGLARALPGPVLVTADTDSGARVARELVPVAARKPVDHPWTLAPLWAEARPARLVWVEGCWWPALDRLARQHGVQTVRVNARPSRGTGFRVTLGLEADLVVARDEEAGAWFRARGVDAPVGGDLKLSAPVGASPLRWSRPFGAAVSTRPGDEAQLPVGGELAWLVAPRHLERVDEVLTLFGGRACRRSALVDGVVPPGADVVVLDTLGELGACLAGAEVAVIGGTFDPRVGGHSPVDAWRQGVPVVCGPEIRSQGGMFERAGARVVWRPSELAAAVREARGERPPPFEGVDVAARVAAMMGRAGGMAGEGSPRPWACGFAAGHRVARKGWHRSWDVGLRAPRRLPVPVVSVGSANARSPGRTPTVRWVLEQLRSRGWRPGVASRGYRRRGSGLVGSWSTRSAALMGDEAALLAREGWPVAVCADRLAAGEALVAHGVDVVVLDDGLQHRHLHRDLDLVVVDGRFPGARGELPMGEAREEPVPARAHGVILHHAHAVLEGCTVPVVRGRRVPGDWHRGDEPRPEGPAGRVAAFAGIGRPADFLSSLEGLEVARFRALADHEWLDAWAEEALCRWAGELPLVCTDKDHVRLSPALANRVWWRTVRLTVEGEAPFFRAFDAR